MLPRNLIINYYLLLFYIRNLLIPPAAGENPKNPRNQKNPIIGLLDFLDFLDCLDFLEK